MYTQVVADLYPEAWLAVSSPPVSTRLVFTNLARSLRNSRCCLVFVVVAFPPPPVTSPATRPESEDPSDFATSKADQVPEARQRFYPRRSGESLATLPFQPGLSAS